jgi:hypothetical protein
LLKVPEKKSSIHIKDFERAELDNPFNAGKLKQLETRCKSKKDEVWAPSYEICDGIKEGSAASKVQLTKHRLEVNTLCPAAMNARL